LYTSSAPARIIARFNAPHGLARNATQVAAAAAAAATAVGLSDEDAQAVEVGMLERVLTDSSDVRAKQKAAGEHCVFAVYCPTTRSLSTQPTV
jgi:predicted regulator of Ras-like GTPase activity (Roadblock/LC7/MglB family)